MIRKHNFRYTQINDQAALSLTFQLSISQQSQMVTNISM